MFESRSVLIAFSPVRPANIGFASHSSMNAGTPTSSMRSASALSDARRSARSASSSIPAVPLTITSAVTSAGWASAVCSAMRAPIEYPTSTPCGIVSAMSPAHCHSERDPSGEAPWPGASTMVDAIPSSRVTTGIHDEPVCVKPCRKVTGMPAPSTRWPRITATGPVRERSRTRRRPVRPGPCNARQSGTPVRRRSPG